MHATVLTEPKPYMRNGSLQAESSLEKLILKLKSAAKPSGSGTHEMEMDEILRILTAIQIEGARRDERQVQIQRQIEELLKFREDRIKNSDLEHRKLTADIEEINRRLKSLEERGLTAWTMKRLTQAAALIAAASSVVGAFGAAAFWIVKKLLG